LRSLIAELMSVVARRSGRALRGADCLVSNHTKGVIMKLCFLSTIVLSSTTLLFAAGCADELNPARLQSDAAETEGTPLPSALPEAAPPQGDAAEAEGTPLPSALPDTPLPSAGSSPSGPDDGRGLAEDDAETHVETPATLTLAGCTLYAEQPYWSTGAIYGFGSWNGCPASAGVTVVLRHDRSWWPDRTLASGSGSGPYGGVAVSYPCGTDYDPIKVFIEVRYGSMKVQSPRATLPCG
jgi:hypothetical protein